TRESMTTNYCCSISWRIVAGIRQLIRDVNGVGTGRTSLVQPCCKPLTSRRFGQQWDARRLRNPQYEIWELVLALTGSNREHPNGEGSSANLFDGLTDQAKPA